MKLLWLMAMSWAEEHGAEQVAHHAGEAHELIIPWSSIFVQAFNLAVLVGLLFFVLRKAVKQHFAERAENYRELVDRAESARVEAERTHSQMKARLEKLEASAAQTVSRAQEEASELRTRLMDEAKTAGRKFEEDALRTIAVELEKAKLELRQELLVKSLSAAEEVLKKGLGTSEQKKLQNEFVEKIEVVGG